MEHVIQFAIALGILFIQYFLSKRGPLYVGAVLPLAYIVFFIYAYATNLFTERSTGSILGAAIGGTVLLLAFWIYGRESLAKKRKKELNKIKAKDLK
ncbi:hypothetical protein C6370_00080 [Bacillus atrophaeus]|uniref:hypothetical protein n=1 Tax=Bacillus subtilis group TaxID=653685 RepID=UPI000D06A4CD|nr:MULTISPECIES: hypothetical protein [Bacillus subtilis group]MCY7902076.1 hypothetical protein [Bacillus inaquosorum]MCY8261558.1 hypothetical protein [Bacillus inaquosorum]MEA1004870.1 hypothetical protein [Bacillus velezensis]PSA95820.1 hypothetical protein C6370_00080 [Bacillus atrophaeus]WNV77944.1 hypothetical protein RUL31_10730 [Bacillus atrophaeus]